MKALIKRTIISQSANKYTFAVLYELEVGLFGFQQNKLSVDQRVERFNTKVNIGDTLGVNRDHPLALVEHVAQELHGRMLGIEGGRLGFGGGWGTHGVTQAG